MLVSGAAEDGDHVGGAVGQPGRGGDQEPGVIVDDVEDLGAGAGGERPVGDVHLPPLVRQVRAEPGCRRTAVVLRLRHYQPAPAQYPPDRRHRRHRVAVAGQVPGDRVRPGIQALPGQVLTQRNDLVFDTGGQPGRRGMRPPRSREQAQIPFSAVTGQALIHPAARHAMRSGDLPDAQAFQHNGLDHIADQIHRTPPHRCPRCLATSVRYLMKRCTARRTRQNSLVDEDQPAADTHV